ncbi:MAG: hypothetical protein IJX67_01425 [Oscillospiraceae bacterium]|nr:hypothetical protein [Oscillospiraceae bacterium]
MSTSFGSTGKPLLRFYDADMQFVRECGDFKVWIGHDSMTDNGTDFHLLD